MTVTFIRLTQKDSRPILINMDNIECIRPEKIQGMACSVLESGSSSAFFVREGVGEIIDYLTANARLISAAPDLYAAVQAALPYVMDHIGTEHTTPHDHAVEAQLRTALAKADGHELEAIS